MLIHRFIVDGRIVRRTSNKSENMRETTKEKIEFLSLNLSRDRGQYFAIDNLQFVKLPHFSLAHSCAISRCFVWFVADGRIEIKVELYGRRFFGSCHCFELNWITLEIKKSLTIPGNDLQNTEHWNWWRWRALNFEGKLMWMEKLSLNNQLRLDIRRLCNYTSLMAAARRKQ